MWCVFGNNIDQKPGAAGSSLTETYRGAMVHGNMNRISSPCIFSSVMYFKRMMTLDLADTSPTSTYKIKQFKMIFNEQ